MREDGVLTVTVQRRECNGTDRRVVEFRNAGGMNFTFKQIVDKCGF